MFFYNISSTLFSHVIDVRFVRKSFWWVKYAIWWLTKKKSASTKVWISAKNLNVTEILYPTLCKALLASNKRLSHILDTIWWFQYMYFEYVGIGIARVKIGLATNGLVTFSVLFAAIETCGKKIDNRSGLHAQKHYIDRHMTFNCSWTDSTPTSYSFKFALYFPCQRTDNCWRICFTTVDFFPLPFKLYRMHRQLFNMRLFIQLT